MSEQELKFKNMHLAEDGWAWTGTIGDDDVTFVAHGKVTGVELFDRCLEEYEIPLMFNGKVTGIAKGWEL